MCQVAKWLITLVTGWSRTSINFSTKCDKQSLIVVESEVQLGCTKKNSSAETSQHQTSSIAGSTAPGFPTLWGVELDQTPGTLIFTSKFLAAMDPLTYWTWKTSQDPNSYLADCSFGREVMCDLLCCLDGRSRLQLACLMCKRRGKSIFNPPSFETSKNWPGWSIFWRRVPLLTRGRTGVKIGQVKRLDDWIRLIFDAALFCWSRMCKSLSKQSAKIRFWPTSTPTVCWTWTPRPPLRFWSEHLHRPRSVPTLWCACQLCGLTV